MPYKVRYSSGAVDDLRRTRPFDRAAVLDQIQKRLMTAPSAESKSLIKQLRQPAPAGFRLRVGDFRVFYDVDGDDVTVLRVVAKREAGQYLGGD